MELSSLRLFSYSTRKEDDHGTRRQPVDTAGSITFDLGQRKRSKAAEEAVGRQAENAKIGARLKCRRCRLKVPKVTVLPPV